VYHSGHTSPVEPPTVKKRRKATAELDSDILGEATDSNTPDHGSPSKRPREDISDPSKEPQPGGSGINKSVKPRQTLVLSTPPAPRRSPTPPTPRRSPTPPEIAHHQVAGVQLIQQQLRDQAIDQQNPVNMAEINNAMTNTRAAMAYASDEIPDFEPADMPLTFLTTTYAKAEEHKEKLSAAMAVLATLDGVNYAANVEVEARRAKKDLIKFIRDGQRHIAEINQRNVAAGSEKDKVQAAAIKIKSDRVIKLLPGLSRRAEDLVTVMQEVAASNTIIDRDLDAILSSYILTEKEVDEHLKDLQSLYADAVSAGLADEAVRLEEHLNNIKVQRIETNKAILAKKVKHGVETRTGSQRSRLKDVKPPLFTGTFTKDSLDLFSFKTEFHEYARSNNYSKEEQCDLLKKACLQGTAKSIVLHLKQVDEVWTKLTETYGDPSLLINAKMRELEKLGKCPDNTEKKREWYVETHSKVDRLLEISKEHKQEQDLYHSGLVGLVRHNLTSHCRNDLRDEVRKYEKDKDRDITKPELFDVLIDFLREGVEDETFNMRFDAMAMKPDTTSQGTKPTTPPESGRGQGRNNKRNYANNPQPPQQQRQQQCQQQPNKGYNKNNDPAGAGPAPPGRGARAPPPYQAQQVCNPKGIHCVVCNEEHFHLYECRNFQGQTHFDRQSLARQLKVCFRCLRSDSRTYRPDMNLWFGDHKKNCKTDWACTVDRCAPDPNKDNWRQRHIVMCEFHHQENQGRLKDFINSLDKAKVLPGLKFFFAQMHSYPVQITADEIEVDLDRSSMLPDVTDPSIYMVQTIPAEPGTQLFAFFDNGCSSASISSRAYSLLDCREIRPGPTTLNVAGGGVIHIKHGDVRFNLELVNNDKVATLSALRMDQVTNKFPYWHLTAAWEELCAGYNSEYPEGAPLPLVDEAVGGVEVDLMLGIKYNQYFPTLEYMLPSGLALYRAQFQTASGNLGVLGGPHKSWVGAVDTANYMGPMAFFTAELRAHHDMSRAMRCIMEFDDIHEELEKPVDDFKDDPSLYRLVKPRVSTHKDTFFSDHEKNIIFGEMSARMEKLNSDQIDNVLNGESNINEPGVGQGAFIWTPGPQPAAEAAEDIYFGQKNIVLLQACNHDHCARHEEQDWVMPAEWDLERSAYTILQDERLLEDAEAAGSEVTYRCVTCRNCIKCRDGDSQERMSLNEEVEEALLVSTLRLEVETKTLYAKLPFIKDPATSLKPNRYLAEKIFDRQMKVIEKNPEMKADILKSHAKLEDKGYVIEWSAIPAEYHHRLDTIGGPGYIIPWQIVYKISSLSTPVRMVMNGSCFTPGGESLNSCLAKGSNSLTKILDILIAFRSKLCALTCDIKMAYNGVRLEAEFFKFQTYLWKHDLNINNPTVLMVIVTIIYGIKPSGQQTIAALKLLADLILKHYPQYKEGALAVKLKAYMDDVATAADSPEAMKSIAEGIVFTLAQGSLSVKDFTFSGSKPSDIVSSDGVHVGLLGYLWDPLMDVMKLDIKEICFEKPKRGKKAPPVVGDVEPELRRHFTKRSLVSQCAKVFDPLGLATPITAKLKLDLHEVSDLKVQWDDALPARLVQTWVGNLEIIKELKLCIFPRTIIPPDAKNTDIHLIVSADASLNITVAALHTRVERTNGDFHCTLLAAKSKLVKGSSVPRAELKAAVLAASLFHISRRNILDQFKTVKFVTDSVITLYWITQDYRPLQVTIRNSVIEIRRFSLPEQWFHVTTDQNIADLGTRPASVEEIKQDSDWVRGKNWMRKPEDQWTLRPINQITLDNQDKVTAAKEMKAPDVGGYMLDPTSDKVGERYQYSKYIVDPCAKPWYTSVGILALVLRVADILKKRPVHNDRRPSEEERKRAEDHLFRTATREVHQFSKKKEYDTDSIMKDGILYRTSRLLEGREYNALENVLSDVEPLSFVKPVVDRYSPIAYSIMVYCHTNVNHHQNAISTLRESFNYAHIIGGRDLANEVRASCTFCRRFKQKLLEVEFGKVHKNRLTCAPSFYHCQIDIMGPFNAICEHQHRATVKVWGLVFKCPATCAVSVHVMTKYNTPAVLMAYTRFASRYGHPAKLFLDQGSQLVRACQEMDVNLMDLAGTLDVRYSVGVEHQTGPVDAHHTQGQVERSIKEVKKLFINTYRGLRLDIMSYETAFSWTANELNCMPIFLGNKYRNIDHLDLMTPSRLLLGRNNRRALSGCATIGGASKIMAQMDSVYDAWWSTWHKEKLIHFIPQPPKWRTTGRQPMVGDAVIFHRDNKDRKIGEPTWRIGQVKTLEPDSDNLIRKVIVEYRNAKETTLRTTRRSVRDIAIVHREEDLELVDKLNAAAKTANIDYLMNADSDRGVVEPSPWSWSCDSIYPPDEDALSTECQEGCGHEEHSDKQEAGACELQEGRAESEDRSVSSIGAGLGPR
jgi:hypothetical protein